MGTNVIQEYSLSDRLTRSSGLLNNVCIKTRNKPMRIGIWTISGPRQPMGFTPLSRYNRMVSWETRCRSPAYRSWISRTFGCNPVIDRICRNCRTVRGMVTTLTSTVNAIIASPICAKHNTYNTNRVLSMGRMMISRQRSPKIAKISTGFDPNYCLVSRAAPNCTWCFLRYRNTTLC